MVDVAHPRNAPIDLSFIPSFRCDLRCPHCMYNSSPENLEELDYEKTVTWVRTVDWDLVNGFAPKPSYHGRFWNKWTGSGTGATTGAPNVASIPNSYHDWIRQQILWARIFVRTSFTWAVPVLALTEPPNFALTMLNVVSTLERLW